MDTLRRLLLPRRARPAVIVCLLLAGAGPAHALAPAEELALAQDYFLVADYATALEKVEGLLEDRTLSPGVAVEARLLQARCHQGLGENVAAVDAFCSLLRSDPGWRPVGDFLTAEELASFRRALDLCGPLTEPAPAPAPAEVGPETAPDLRISRPAPRSRPWFRNPWLLGAAGGVTAGLILILQEGGGEEARPHALPDFPLPPR